MGDPADCWCGAVSRMIVFRAVGVDCLASGAQGRRYGTGQAAVSDSWLWTSGSGSRSNSSRSSERVS